MKNEKKSVTVWHGCGKCEVMKKISSTSVAWIWSLGIL